METLEISLFGAVTVAMKGGGKGVVVSGKPGLLLALLASAGSVRRDDAITLIYGEAATAVTRGRLRSLIHQLRTLLSSAISSDCAYLPTEGNSLYLTIDVMTDEAHFRAAINGARVAPESVQSKLLADALALYHADFLGAMGSGIPTWFMRRRYELAVDYAAALDSVARRCRNMPPADAEEEARAIITNTMPRLGALGSSLAGFDPGEAVNDVLFCAAMNLHIIAGQPSQVSSRFKELEIINRREPSAEAKELLKYSLELTDGFATRKKPIFGRETDLKEGSGMLHGGSRLISLVGPPGVGKTRLAEELIASNRVRFTRVISVPLREFTDSEHACRALIESSGFASAEDMIEQAQRWENHLLFLDNVEQLVENREGGSEFLRLIARLTASIPGLTILTTTRTALALAGERQYGVRPLKLPDTRLPLPEVLLMYPSVEMFVHFADRNPKGFNLTASNAGWVREICELADGLPLAIMLLASTVAVHKPAQIRQMIRAMRVAPLGDSEGESYFPSLHAAIQWSFRRLPSDRLRHLFSGLAVFHGSFTWRALVGICIPQSEPAQQEAHANLSILLHRSLISAVDSDDDTPERFLLLDTVRDFSERQLAPGRLERLKRRHAAHYFTVAVESKAKLTSTEQAEAYADLDMDRHNLAAALTLFSESTDGAIKALVMVESLWGYWEVRSRFLEGLELAERALSHPMAQTPVRERMKALVAAGALAFRVQRFDDAAIYWEEAGYIATVVKDRDSEARCLGNRATLASTQGDTEKSVQLHEESLQILREIGTEPDATANSKRSVGVTLLQLGNALYRAGKHDAGFSKWEQSRPWFQAAGYRRGEARALSNMAVSLKEAAFSGGSGNQTTYVRAVALQREALTLRDPGDQEGIASSVEEFADLASLRGTEHEYAFLSAFLYGATKRMYEEMGLPFAPTERYVSLATETLGEKGFASAWQQGFVEETGNVVTRIKAMFPADMPSEFPE